MYWAPNKTTPHLYGNVTISKIEPDVVIRGFAIKTENLADTKENRHRQTLQLDGRVQTVVFKKVVFFNVYYPTQKPGMCDIERKAEFPDE